MHTGSVLFPHMTVEENVAYVPELLNGRDKAKTRAAVSKWLRTVGLEEDMRRRYPSQLSGGQQQRVGIARALAASPEILLMDEPFGAVDSITRAQLQTEIKEIHRKTGVTIVFVTHDYRKPFIWVPGCSSLIKERYSSMTRRKTSLTVRGISS